MSSTSLPPALERAASLLKEPPRQPDAGNGYLDLLPGQPVPPNGRVQAMWLSKLGSGAYEWLHVTSFALMKGFYFGAAFRALAPNRGDVILDVGCGPGDLTSRLGEMVGADGLVLGVDVSPAMLERAVRHTPANNIGLLRAGAQDLPFADAGFDAVWSSAAIQLFPDPFAALDEMARVLRPGGRLVLMTPSRGQGRGRAAAEAVIRYLGAHAFGQDDLPRALVRRGFTDVRHRAGMLQIVAGRKPG